MSVAVFLFFFCTGANVILLAVATAFLADIKRALDRIAAALAAALDDGWDEVAEESFEASRRLIEGMTDWRLDPGP